MQGSRYSLLRRNAYPSLLKCVIRSNWIWWKQVVSRCDWKSLLTRKKKGKKIFPLLAVVVVSLYRWAACSFAMISSVTQLDRRGREGGGRGSSKRVVEFLLLRVDVGVGLATWQSLILDVRRPRCRAKKHQHINPFSLSSGFWVAQRKLGRGAE